MNEKHTKEYMEKLGNLKLSDSARQRIEENLDAYVDYNPVRIADGSRSMSSVSQTTSWYTALFTVKRTTMPLFAIAAVILVGGGTTFAAQGSLPGDLLYPVKTEINENVRGVLAFSADAEARLQAELLEERVEEAEKLEAEGRFEGELENEVKSNVATQYQTASRANAEADADTDGAISLSLGRLATILSNDGSVAMDSQTESRTNANTRMMAFDGAQDDVGEESAVSASADMSVSSELALEPIDVGQLQRMTSARMESLREVLERYKNEIRADVYAEFIATLNEADELMIEVALQSNTDTAREILFEVSDLVGKVEAALSTMGQVKIDAETGAIVDIKLGATPVVDEPDYEVDPRPSPLPMPPDVLETTGSLEVESTVNSMTETAL